MRPSLALISEPHSCEMEEQNAIPDQVCAIPDPELAENDSSTFASDPEEVSPSTFDEGDAEENARDTASNAAREFMREFIRQSPKAIKVEDCARQVSGVVVKVIILNQSWPSET